MLLKNSENVQVADANERANTRSKDARKQLHVDLTRAQYDRLHVAMLKLGYRTIAEVVRENVRKIISEAEGGEKNDR